MQKTFGITILFVFAVLCFGNSGQPTMTLSTADEVSSLLKQYNRQVIPDVMGYVNIIETTESGVRQRTLQLDDFTIMAGWPITVSGTSFEGGIYCNMDADPELEIIYNTGFTIHALNPDTTNVPGWPITLSYVAEGAPAFGDIDGDGTPEIVVGSIYTMTTGAIYAFELNGTPVTGFPIIHGYASRTIVLADLDGDDDLEIITNKRMWPLGEQWVYDGDGTVYPGWPQPLGHVPASSAAVGDITGDGIPEIIGESYDALYVWNINGDLLPGFPFMMPYSAVNSYSSPVLADLDNDGLPEIIFGTHVLSGGGYVFVLNHDGSQLPGFPKYTNWWIYGPPAVGYIDNDDTLDIAVGDQVLSPSPTDYVYAWNAAGHTLPGFPIGPINAINNQVALADLDNDGMTELLFDDNTSPNGIYLGYNHDGTPMAGFPLQVQGTTFFNMPCLTDLDSDGFLNIVGASRFQTDFTKIYLWASDVPYSADNVQIPVWQYSVTHDGVMPAEPTYPPQVQVTLTPYGVPIIITTSGGNFDFNFRVDYMETPPFEFDGWIMLQAPDSSWSGPVMGPITLPMQGPGSSYHFDTTFTVQAGLDTGTFAFQACIGRCPGDIWDFDSFQFQIIADTTHAKPDRGEVTPTQFTLQPAYPNPFNATTMLSFSLPYSSKTKLTVLNILAQPVTVLLDGYRHAGTHRVAFDATALPSGIYFCYIQAGSHQAIQKIILLK